MKKKIYKLQKYERCFPRETLIQIKKKTSLGQQGWFTCIYAYRKISKKVKPDKN